MRLLDTNTRYFDQDTFQIPQLENTWGCLIDVLDTALVVGSTTQNVLGISVTVDTLYPELYWMAKVKLSEGHGFKKQLSVIEIVNSNITAFNGIFRVQEITSDTISIALPKVDFETQPLDLIFVDGVQIRTPSLGYEKPFEGVHKAVYKVTNDTNKKAFLRVDNSCPNGYNPSYSKFARVSMFTEIEGIDDYTFKLGRQKAPSKKDTYNGAEENRESVWLTVKNKQTLHVFDTETTLNFKVDTFTIIGDNKTFYFLEREILSEHNPIYVGDFLYTFGEYNKNMNKDDPNPFLMNASIKHDPRYYSLYNKLEHFRGDNELGKFLFNSDTTHNFLAESSDYWSFWLTDMYRSGGSERINFKPYKNEVVFSVLPNLIRSHRKEGVFLEGALRGIYNFSVNFKDTPELTPQHLKVLDIDGDFYLTLSVRDYSNQDIKFAMSLSNWE